MTPYREKLAREAINECLTILYNRATYGTRSKPTVAELNTIRRKLGVAQTTLADHLWDKKIA